ncbi:MAG: hypothetical protein MR852_05025 [Treponema sp.]|nr:hypothetical protein [Treponema sp.]
MKELITISDGELRLTSNLDEYSFGKTNYDSIVTQEGLLFDGKNFTSWTFSDVKSFEDPDRKERIVFYCGKNPLSSQAKTLAAFYKQDDEESLQAVKAVCQAYQIAAKSKLEFPIMGAGGILVDLSKNETKILFLPQGLYKNTVSGLSASDYYEEEGAWINQTIYNLPAICFERAVFVYKLLTGSFPYANIDQIERNADILDQNFLPLEMAIDGIDLQLAKEVNKALKLNSNVVNIPGKKKKGKNSEDLKPNPDFPMELLDQAWKLSKEQKAKTKNTDFEEKAQSYMKRKKSQIRTKRRIRRNTAKIGVGIALAIVLATLISNTIKTNQGQYYTKGLTSTQTIQAFFMGINAKDVTMISNFVKGKTPQNYVDMVSQIYVLSKQRKIYDKDNGFASPENWLLFSTNAEKYDMSGLYGVTQLKIDGTAYPINVKVYKKNQKPEAVTQEGDILLKDKDQSVRKVEYYLLHSEGENFNIVVEKITDIFTLTYKKDRWIITDISSSSESVRVKPLVFKNDYLNQLILTNGDVIKAVDQLRLSYDWLPGKTELEMEKELMEWNLTHIYDQKLFIYE